MDGKCADTRKTKSEDYTKGRMCKQTEQELVLFLYADSMYIFVVHSTLL
jgi:hypothetical protein